MSDRKFLIALAVITVLVNIIVCGTFYVLSDSREDAQDSALRQIGTWIQSVQQPKNP